MISFSVTCNIPPHRILLNPPPPPPILPYCTFDLVVDSLPFCVLAEHFILLFIIDKYLHLQMNKKEKKRFLGGAIWLQHSCTAKNDSILTARKKKQLQKNTQQGQKPLSFYY